jgi:hypothetical protein
MLHVGVVIQNKFHTGKDGALVEPWLKVLLLIAQLFRKVQALNPLAPTG